MAERTDDPEDWRTLLKKPLSVRDEDANREFSGKIEEEFACDWHENREIKIVADNSDQRQEGWDLKNADEISMK